MSTPFTDYKSPFEGVVAETISAMSSLNMPPDALSEPIDDGFYLSETDANVAHAMSHLREVIVQARKARNQYDSICNKVQRLFWMQNVDRKIVVDLLTGLAKDVYDDEWIAGDEAEAVIDVIKSLH